MPLVLDGTNGVSGVDGTASNPSYEGTDSNTGIFYPAADTVAIGTGGTEALRVNSSQNVGVGTTNPLFKLVVSKAGAEGIEFVPGGTSNVSTTQYYNRSGAVYTANAQDASFHSWLISGTERARITSGGDFLVGTTTSGAGTGFDCKLTVTSNAVNPAVFKWDGTALAAYPLRTWNTATSGNNIFVDFATEATYTSRGSIDYNRGAGQVRYNATSDATLKNIIGDSDGQKSVEILNSTRIREFSWKNDEQQKPQIGVIAQELYETYKGAVSVGGDIEKTDEEGNVTTEYRPWGVDKTAFTFHLIAGWQAHEKMIKEQQAMIDELKAKVATLENV